MIRSLKQRASVVAIVATLIALLGAGPAIGIVYGESDNGEHPYVGSIVAEIPALGGVFQICSGTVVEGVDEDVFVTAAHCLLGLEEFLQSIDPASKVWVTFDQTIDVGGNFYSGTLIPHPGFPGPANNTYDIGVILLDDEPGVGYGVLPEAGLLDSMQADHTLRDETFTTVGYGTVRETRQMAWQSILDNLDRNKGDQEALSLTGSWLTLSMNEATANAGTCFGDSGGPHFLSDQITIVSVTVTGDANCKATDKTYRTDTPTARDFLDDYISLP